MKRLSSIVIRLSDMFYGAAAALGVLAAFAMIVHVVANVVGRSFFNAPISGTNEAVTYWYMPAIALIGFMFAERQQEHTKTRILFDRLPKKVQGEVDIIGQTLILIVFVLFGWFSLGEALRGFQMGATGGVAGLVIWPFLFLAPLAFFVMALHIGSRLLARFLKHPKASK